MVHLAARLWCVVCLGCGGAQVEERTTCDQALAEERSALEEYLVGHGMDEVHRREFLSRWMEEHPSESEIAELEEVDEHTPGPGMERVIEAMRTRLRLCPDT